MDLDRTEGKLPSTESAKTAASDVQLSQAGLKSPICSSEDLQTGIATLLRVCCYLSQSDAVRPSNLKAKNTALKAHQTKPIRWAGSKLPIASCLEHYIDFNSEYYEPFAGSAVLFFRNTPRHAFLNDLNSALVSFYLDAREHTEALWKIYSSLPTEKDTYYWVRSEFNRMRKCVRRSAYFMYLNHLCFNGIYRTNLKNEFNTPFGGGRLKPIEKTDFFRFAKLTQAAEFYNLDFESFLDAVNPRCGTIYMDPPYYTEGQRVFREYGPETFSHEDLIRLSTTARKWASKGCRVVVSYRECSEFRELFDDCIQEEINVSRNVGGFKNRRNSQKELIAVLA